MDERTEERRRWFQGYVTRAERGVYEPRRPEVRCACPCCGYPTLEERGGCEICALCNWEDDGQDDPHAGETWGGPNGAYSLSEARENFERYLIMYSPDKIRKGRIGAEDSPTEKQAKRAMVKAFDEMPTETDPRALVALWQRVYNGERLLERELQRKVREYEAWTKDQNTTQ